MRPPSAAPGRRPLYRALSPRGQVEARARRPRPGPLPYVANVDTWPPPVGYRVARELGEVKELLLAAATAAPAGMRCDGRRTRRAVLEAVLDAWQPGLGLAMIGHAGIAAKASAILGRRVARSTAGNHVRALVDQHVLGVALHGCSKAVNGVRDLAPNYVVLAPDWTADDEAQLADLRRRIDGHPPVGEGSEVKEVDTPGRSFYGSKPISPIAERPERVEHPERYRPRDLGERLLTANWLIDALGWEHSTDRQEDLADALRRFFRAGWTGQAILRGAWTTPDGVPLGGLLAADGVYAPVRALMARLKAWRAPDGTPVPSPWPGRPVRRGPLRAGQRAERSPVALPTPPARTRPPTAAQALAAAAGLRIGAARG